MKLSTNCKYSVFRKEFKVSISVLLKFLNKLYNGKITSNQLIVIRGYECPSLKQQSNVFSNKYFGTRVHSGTLSLTGRVLG